MKTRVDGNATTYLVNTLPVVQVLALGELASFLVGFKVTQADKAALFVNKFNPLALVNSYSNESGAIDGQGRGLDLEDATSVGDILVTSNRGFDWAKQGRQQHHVFIGWRVSEEAGCGKDGMVFRIATAEDVDDPAARALRMWDRVVRLNDAVASRGKGGTTVVGLTKSTLARCPRTQRLIFGCGLQSGGGGGTNDTFTSGS